MQKGGSWMGRFHGGFSDHVEGGGTEIRLECTDTPHGTERKVTSIISVHDTT